MNMTQAEAAVLAEWDAWPKDPDKSQIILIRSFADWFEKNRPDVTWRSRILPSEDIRIWIVKHES